MKLATMDLDKVAQVLQATLDPSQREATEKHLQEFQKIIGFTPALLHLVISDKYELPVRQAGVVYLKNMITKFWADAETENPAEPLAFHIHENDRQTIRQNIVDAIIHSPEPIRIQLCVCISNIIKHDYPGRFADVGNKIHSYIQSSHPAEFMGSLMCLHQFVKNYEYKLTGDRSALNEPMKHLLPIIFDRCTQLMPDASDMALLLQKQILKIFFALTQNNLPLSLVTKEVMLQWMQLCRDIMMKPIRLETVEIDKDELCEQPSWKLKKWAVHIMSRIFDKFGSPGNVIKAYEEFAEWFLKSVSYDNITVLLKVLDQYRQKNYVSPRVIQLSLEYINHAVKHAFSWKFIKPYIQTIIQEVVFPLMCHSDEDEELWDSDPIEYIRVKFDVFEDFLSPVMAAQTLLYTSCSKRKDVLQKTMTFCMQVMTSPNCQPREKDGALHFLGSVADVVLKRKLYRDEAEKVLTQHVFPEFTSPHGFLRAKACWVLHYFSELRYQNDTTLIRATEFAKNLLCHDPDLPVRVEAAIALQMLACEQDSAQEFLKPHLKTVIMELLTVMKETELEDLTQCLQKLVLVYVEEIIPLAIEMTTHMAELFCKLVDSEDDDDDEMTDSAVTAISLLTTMDTLLAVICEQCSENGTHTVKNPDATVLKLEEILMSVIYLILQKHVLDYYEEVMGLICTLTTTHISPRMWQVFRMVYEVFQSDGFDYFTDMMSALHNYVTVDPEAFSSSPEYLESLYNMCKKILESEPGEDAECHATKLLEIILLQYGQLINQVMPSFIQLSLQRLTQEIKTSELRAMCIQVVVAALYVNPELVLHTLSTIQMPNSNANVVSHFLNQWINDTDCIVGLHDRKLSILGLCALMNLGTNRPSEVSEVASHFVPACLLLFSGIKRAYASKAKEDEDSDDENGIENADDSDLDDETLEDDHDAIDDETTQYLSHLENCCSEDESGDEHDNFEGLSDGAELTNLEIFNTTLDDDKAEDEYIVFKALLQRLESSDSAWYIQLVSGLTDEQKQQLTEVFKLAEQRKAVKDSRKIEEEGGYKFPSLTVPNSFNFGSQ